MDTILHLTAREVRPGDKVLNDDGSVAFRVHTAETFGKRSQSTTLAKLNDPAPKHMDPNAKLRVIRNDR